MKELWTILGVAVVAGSFRWYVELLGLPETSRPAHDYFGRLVDREGRVLVCLHRWGEHEHPPLRSSTAATPGNGLLLFFRVDDFERTLDRARSLVDELAEQPHHNPNTGASEFSLRDPDGYYVTVSDGG